MKNGYKILLTVFALAALVTFQNCSGSSSADSNQQLPESGEASFINLYSQIEIKTILPNYFKGNSKVVSVDPEGKGFLINTEMVGTKSFVEVTTKPTLSFREIPDFGLLIEKIQYNFDGTKIILIQPSNGLKRILVLNRSDFSIHSTIGNVVTLEYVSNIRNAIIYMHGERISTHYYSPETYKYKIYDLEMNASKDFYVEAIPGCYNCAPPEIDSFYIADKYVYYAIKNKIFKFDLNTNNLNTLSSLAEAAPATEAAKSVKFVFADANKIYFNSDIQFKGQFYYGDLAPTKTNYIYSLTLDLNEIGAYPPAVNQTINASYFELVKNASTGFIYFDHLKKTFNRVGENKPLLSVNNEKAYYSQNESLILLESSADLPVKDRYLNIFNKK